MINDDLKEILRAGITGRANATITKPEQFSNDYFAYFLQGANNALRLLNVHYSDDEVEVLEGAAPASSMPAEQDAATAFSEGYAEMARRAKLYGGIDLPSLEVKR